MALLLTVSLSTLPIVMRPASLLLWGLLFPELILALVLLYYKYMHACTFKLFRMPRIWLFVNHEQSKQWSKSPTKEGYNCSRIWKEKKKKKVFMLLSCLTVQHFQIYLSHIHIFHTQEKNNSADNPVVVFCCCCLFFFFFPL